MADEILGSASVVIDLDSQAADADANRLGNRIERALDRASRSAGNRIQQNIKQAIRALSPVKVQVAAETHQFERAVRNLGPFGPVRVDVEPSVTRAAFQAALDTATVGLTVKVNVVPEVNNAQFAAAVAAVQGGAVQIDIRPRLDRGRIDAAIRDLGEALERELDQSSIAGGARMVRNLRFAARDARIKVPVSADIRNFRRTVDGLNNLDAVHIKLLPDIDAVAFRTAIERVASKLTVKVKVVPDMSGFNDAVRAHQVPDINVRVNADRSSLSAFAGALGKVGGALGSLGKLAGVGAAIGAIGIAAASATQSILALTAALAPAVGILAAVPAVALTTVAAFGALKLAVSGVGDAFSAGLTGDAKKFEEALENLSPAAQSVAREVRDLKPAFDDLRKTVQDRFFAQIAGDITATAEALGGTLKQGLSDIAGGWGRAADSALTYVRSTDGVERIGQILSATTLGVDGLANATGPVVRGFLDIGGAVATAFGDRFGGAVESAGTRLGEFLTNAANSGDAIGWVENALTVFKQLGSIIGNVGATINNVFSAANDVGGGFLANLKEITGQMKAFTASAQGQEAISGIFTALAAVAAQLGPILSALVTQVGAIGPQLVGLFTTIGPAIVTALNAIGPALQGILPGVQAVVNGLSLAIGSIASSGALTSLGAAFGQILTAVAPLLPVVGQLAGILGNVLGSALSTLAGALAPVISALASALAPVLPVIGTALLNVVAAVSPLANLLGTLLASAITTLSPLLAGLSEVFAAVTAALIPIGQAITDALLPVMPSLISSFQSIVAAIMPMIPTLIQVATFVGQFAVKLIEIVAPALQFLAAVQSWAVMEFVVPMITAMVQALQFFVDKTIAVYQAVVTFGSDVANAFQNLKDRVVGAVTEVYTQTVSFFTNLGNNVNSLVNSLVSQVVSLFNSLKSNAVSIVSGLVSSVVTFFAGLPGKAASALNGIISSIAGVLNSAASGARTIVSSMISTLTSTIAELPGRARTALGGIGSALYDAGIDLIQGMINGIKAAAGRIASAAKDVVSGAINAAKSALGISSPSKVFRTIGGQTMQGLALGIEGGARMAAQAATNAVKLVQRAFESNTLSTPGATFGAPSATTSRNTGNTGRFEDLYGIDDYVAPRNARFGNVRSSVAGQGRVINNTFNITEASSADATARKVIRDIIASSAV